MTEQTNKPEALDDADLENAQGGTISVQICHQVVSDNPPVDRDAAPVRTPIRKTT